MQIVIDIPNTDYQVILTKIMLACHGCKITELPKGHGRLIDADELFEKVGRISPNSQRQHDDIGLFMYMITNSSTIIEADKGVSDEQSTDSD